MFIEKMEPFIGTNMTANEANQLVEQITNEVCHETFEQMTAELLQDEAAERQSIE